MGGNGRYKHTMETPGRKIVMTRVFDAPRELVFDAHSSCEHVSNWWGPRNYEVVKCEIDFRPGGAWRIAHRGPDDGPYETPVFFGEYREIVRPERFVWTFGFEGMPGEPGPETYVFEEHEGRPRSRAPPSSTRSSSATRSSRRGWRRAPPRRGIGSTSISRSWRSPRLADGRPTERASGAGSASARSAATPRSSSSDVDCDTAVRSA